MTETLRQRLLRHEGMKLRAYKDSLGILTIGVGRNVQNVGISEDEALYMLDNDIDAVKSSIAHYLPWVLKLDQARQDVIYEMCFQLGRRGLIGFKNMMQAVLDGRYMDAAAEMLDSDWAKQTPNRAKELASIMRTGVA